MRKILLIILSSFYIIITNASLKDSMMLDENSIWIDWDWVWVINIILIYVKDLLFYILWFVAVAVFLYFWFKLISSRWNEEEFKKTLMWFIYAIVWLAIIPLSYWLVKLVVSLRF